MANELAKTQPSIKSLMANINVKQRFEEILGQGASAFMSGVVSVVNGNKQLQECDPNTILGAAVVAATLKLPVNAQLGQAHIVPYGGKAQFQIGWKGLVQLAMRTGQYSTMNCTEVYEGELVKHDRITGDVEFDQSKRKSAKIIGYVSYFRLINGFEKYLYMTVAEVEAHGKKFSKTYDKSFSSWKTNTHAMALKTVMKLLLGKWGILSVDMQLGLQADQAVVDEGTDEPFEFTYVDNGNIIEAEVVPEATESETEKAFREFQEEKAAKEGK